MVEPTLNNENPTQEYIGTTTYNLYCNDEYIANPEPPLT